MIEWHVIESWTTWAARQTAWWPAVQLIGGCAAPLFLFLAGLAAPFAIASHVARGVSPAQASWLVQKRGWQVFLVAHLFRFQSFLTNPFAKWSDLLTPDILNILGLGLAGTAWLAGRARTWRRGVWWLIVPAALVIGLTPWTPSWWWPSLLHPRIAAYFRPSEFGVFAIFPSIALVFAGGFLGLVLVEARDAAGERRLHAGLAVAAALLIGSTYAIAAITSPAVTRWIGIWSLFFTQMGYITLAIVVLWLAMQWGPPDAATEPLAVFGRTSLFVYWVHVELAYGFASYPLHRALPFGWAIVGFAVVTVIMYVAARWWLRKSDGPWIPARLRAA